MMIDLDSLLFFLKDLFSDLENNLFINVSHSKP